ncbi:MAG: D-alanyl-D-alanine carboxypeptidase [Oscillospiraceae bacterium]|nr:D-alanyl-D-alanine carboxypeptidase [Oscillospiraceae bacterium]
MKSIAKTLILFLFITFTISTGIFDTDAVEFKPPMKIHSQAVLLVNTDTEEPTVVYRKNADKRIAPASLTKIMTAIIVLESGADLETKVKVKQEMVYHEDFAGLSVSNAGFKPDEEVRLIDVLYATVMCSACEGANILADYFGNGSIPAFVDMMNAKVAELGLKDTQFANAHGLDAKGQYTTADDMYKITSYALEKYPLFEKISTETKYSMPATNKNNERSLLHTNIMLYKDIGNTLAYNYYDERVKGLKTGTTDASGRSLVTLASDGKYNYMLITLKAPIKDKNGVDHAIRYSYTDHKELYGWAFDNFKIRPVLDKDETIPGINVRLGKDKDYVALKPAKTIYAFIRNDISNASIKIDRSNLPETLTAPISKDEVVGKVKLILANQELASADLVAAESIDRSILLFILDAASKVAASQWFWTAVVLIVILVFVYMILIIKHNNRRKRRQIRNVNRYKR